MLCWIYLTNLKRNIQNDLSNSQEFNCKPENCSQQYNGCQKICSTEINKYYSDIATVYTHGAR